MADKWSIDSSWVTHRGDRSENQDRATNLKEDRVCGVADGMGGERGGSEASRIAMEEVERWARAVDGLVTGFAAFDLFAHINRRIVEAGLANEHWRGMGTTLTLVYLRTGQFYFAHIGDSRLYILREGHLRQLTQDHNQASELQREGVLSPEEAPRSPLRHVLSRSLGTIRTIAPQIDSCDWRDGDRLLLCTDGLHAGLAHGLIASVLAEANTADEAAQHLLAATLGLDQADQDNLTALTVFLSTTK